MVQEQAIPLNERKKTLRFGGCDLLSYPGNKTNYRNIGRFLALKMLTRDERENLCWFPSRKQSIDSGRGRVPAEMEKIFRGNYNILVNEFRLI